MNRRWYEWVRVAAVSRFFSLMLLSLGVAWNAEAETGCHQETPFLLTFNDNLVSMEAENICLGAILRALEDQSDARIHVPSSLDGKPVSASFERLPFEQAIKLILKETSYVLQTKSKHNSWVDGQPADPEGVEIWLTSERPASEAIVSDRTSGSSDGQESLIDLAAVAEQSRFAPEPEVRAYAVQLIAQTRDRAKAAQIILASLQDPAPQVRRAALMAMAELDPAVTAPAADLIADIALHDESSAVRKLALLKLIEEDFRSEATSIVMTEALYDENPEIKELARELSRLLDE